ncbi:sperm-associated antigen 16 protein [Genypterus blacodes]|uniref:sperm-associated antigen 16 protein n=1 Tax=Genypterus blacodes TaxID=154954 RepID=UPI003F76420C
MSSPLRNHETKSFLATLDVLDDSDDDFPYDEVSVKDDWSLAEDVGDLEATVKAVQERVTTSAAPVTSPLTGTDPLEAVDDFIRNSLLRMDMMDTLDCFQTEWYEISQKGPVDCVVVPAAYTENQRLQNALTSIQLEGEEYRLEASRLSDSLMKVQRARDHHRMQHMRAAQERDKLVQDMKRLKAQCESYEPAFKRLHEKYQAVLRHFTLLNMERDKEKNLNASQEERDKEKNLNAPQKSDAGRKEDRGATSKRGNSPKD